MFKMGQLVNLPELSEKCKYLMEQQKVMEKGCAFISHYGQHFWKTNPLPSQSDYNSMGLAIIKRHPEFISDASGRPQAYVCKLLSNFYRNKRQALKKLAANSVENENEDQDDNFNSKTPQRNQNRSKGPSFPPAVDNEIIQPDSEVQKLLQALDDLSYMGATTHVVRLLRETFSYRVKVIEELGSASQIVAKYAQLKQSELILHELSLRVKKEVLTIMSKLKACLEELAEFYEIHPFEGTDQDQTEAVLHMYNMMKPKNTSLKAEPLLILEKTLKPVDLNSVKDDGPRLTLFFTEDVGIASAFILADESIKVKVDRYDFVKTLCTLVGAYHAWNVGYPKGYKTVLTFIDEELFLMNPQVPSVSFHKLRKAFLEFRWRETAALE